VVGRACHRTRRASPGFYRFTRRAGWLDRPGERRTRGRRPRGRRGRRGPRRETDRDQSVDETTSEDARSSVERTKTSTQPFLAGIDGRTQATDEITSTVVRLSERNESLHDVVDRFELDEDERAVLGAQ
jgi:hypothetical protein